MMFTLLTYLFWLIISVTMEVIGTLLLPQTDNFKNKSVTLLCMVCYVMSFYALSMLMDAVTPVVAYAVWSGFGIVMIALMSSIFYQMRSSVLEKVGDLLHRGRSDCDSGLTGENMKIDALSLRVRQLRDNYLQAKPFVSARRALNVTRVYKENPGMDNTLLRALAFRRACENAPLYVADNELIVSHPAGGARGGEISPEISWRLGRRRAGYPPAAGAGPVSD
ncbi:Pyruvate formate-lyase [Enterobacter cancerogenus]|uniref:Pyruvate formate-lyase n=1 Tax=Enterobacter cancerogenus TaxID=69218 RepID=A0A484Z5K7_9ENTR|nr:Pyruvate formate-lyase [Enterobacter cancerogenus]